LPVIECDVATGRRKGRAKFMNDNAFCSGTAAA